MISYIEGTIDEVKPDGIVLDHEGFGFEICVPQSDLVRLHRGEEVRIFTYLQVRDDGFSLFGFTSREERDLFILLIGVNGIGPKAAVSILGVLSADDLRFAIAAEDDKAIARAPGIGKKTAQRIILDLRDKIDFVGAVEEKVDAGSDAPEAQDARSEAILALNSLGYSSSEALRAISDIDTAGMSVEDIIRHGLKNLAM